MSQSLHHSSKCSKVFVRCKRQIIMSKQMTAVACNCDSFGRLHIHCPSGTSFESCTWDGIGGDEAVCSCQSWYLSSTKPELVQAAQRIHLVTAQPQGPVQPWKLRIQQADSTRVLPRQLQLLDHSPSTSTHWQIIHGPSSCTCTLEDRSRNGM
jgi:hypothetical protein